MSVLNSFLPVLGITLIVAFSPCHICGLGAALQAATILVAMASGKNFWRLKFWRKSPIGDQQIKRETYGN